MRSVVIALFLTIICHGGGGEGGGRGQGEGGRAAHFRRLLRLQKAPMIYAGGNIVLSLPYLIRAGTGERMSNSFAPTGDGWVLFNDSATTIAFKGTVLQDLQPFCFHQSTHLGALLTHG